MTSTCRDPLLANLNCVHLKEVGLNLKKNRSHYSNLAS